MGESTFRPWLVTLVICVVGAVIMMIWMNGSGGYANPPWFVGLGLSVGGTLACVWLIVRNLITFRWVTEDSPPAERRVPLDDTVQALLTQLTRRSDLGAVVQPIVRTVLADRLLRFHAVDLEVEPERAASLVPAAVLAVAAGQRTVSLDQLPQLLDQLDALYPPADGGRADQDQDGTG